MLGPAAASSGGSSPASSSLLVAGTAAGATLLLTSDSGDPAVLACTPADSVAYAELRLDLPGSQSAELAKVMKAFPGFEDQAAFPMKLSEALDLLVGQATDGQQGYKNDIEPWFGGQIGVSAGPLPTTADPAAARAVAAVQRHRRRQGDGLGRRRGREERRRDHDRDLQRRDDHRSPSLPPAPARTRRA